MINVDDKDALLAALRSYGIVNSGDLEGIWATRDVFKTITGRSELSEFTVRLASQWYLAKYPDAGVESE